MPLKLEKKAVKKLVIVNLILSIPLLLVSSYMHSFVMYGMDSGVLSFSYKIISSIGEWLTFYFLLPAFLLPKAIAHSFVGGILAFISSFIMTIPITVGLGFVLNKIKNKIFG
jgi:hypothetical protein